MPDDPIFIVAGRAATSSIAGATLQHGKPFWKVEFGIWPCVVGGERYDQALPHLSCDVMVDSSAKKSSYWLHLLLLGSGLWTILFCQIFLCMADAWIISGQMAGFGDILIWAISKSFGDVSSLVLTASTSHSIPTEWAVPGFKRWEGQVLELSNVLSKNHRRVQKGMCTLKDWNSNSDFFQKLKSI